MSEEIPANYCPNCKTKFPENAKYCPKCGRKRPTLKGKKCKNCGSIVKLTDKFCPKCGVPLNPVHDHKLNIIAPDIDPPTCMICRKPVTDDIVFCPNCRSPFHYPHLLSWVKTNNECPVCKTKLIIRE